MNGETVPILGAILVQSALCLIVFVANPRNKTNQIFLFVSLAAVVWLACLYLGSTTANSLVVARYMRQASAAGVLVLALFNLLRLSIRERNKDWRGLLRQSRVWIILTIGMIILCQTAFFVEAARIVRPVGMAAPVPVYGTGAVFYALYFAGAAVALVLSLLRDLRNTSGRQHAEIAFVLIGTIFTAIFPLITVSLRSFVEESTLLWFAPFRVVLFSIVVAYGIATRKLMEIGVLFRRLTSYGLLAAYILTLYALIWWLVTTALQSSTANAHTIAHVTAAVVVAFAMAPARGMSQRLAERLFIGSHQLDFRATVSRAAKILASCRALRDLLDRFANTVVEAVGTDRVLILLPDRQGFSQRYPIVESGSRYYLELTRDQATIAELESNREPIVLDELRRVKPTPQLQRVMRQLDSLEVALAMGIFARDHLAGVLLLGARKSRRIYGAIEQGALQVLCGQLAVAIENAELFTEVQNAKIYNETLLENLTSGVIAAGTDERVTVFNNEAGDITGLNSQEMLDGSLGALPLDLAEPLITTLRTGESQENREIVMHVGTADLIIRASTS